MSETKKSNGFRFSILKVIALIIRFFILEKVTKWRTFFEKRKKRVFFSPFSAHKKQLESKFEKVLYMRYCYSCKEYVVKISKDSVHWFRRFYQQGVEKRCFEKNPFKLFLMKNREENLPALNQQCLHHTVYLLLLHNTHFHPK